MLEKELPSQFLEVPRTGITVRLHETESQTAVGMLGFGHGWRWTRRADAYCGNGSDSEDGATARRARAAERPTARHPDGASRASHSKDSSGTASAVTRGAGAGQETAGTRELAKELEKERSCGRPTWFAAADKHPRLGCSLGTGQGRGPVQPWTGERLAPRHGPTRTKLGGPAARPSRT